VVTTYYWRPYRSGLTLHAARIAEALAGSGAHVEAIVARHDRSLPERELVNGVDVRRLPVALRADRGVLAPRLLPAFARAAARADAAVIFLPLAEAGALALLGPRGRTACYYVCDPVLPARRGADTLTRVLDASAALAVRRCALVSALSLDYARSSRVLGPVADRVTPLAPIVATEQFTRTAQPPPPHWRLAPRPARRVGYVGRLAREKGLQHLIDAVARLPDRPQLVLAGDSSDLAGGGERAHLERRARSAGVDARFLGPLPTADLALLYSSLDVLALPSVEALEAYGMVQVEAMLCGTPVVASALPGVREVVGRTGMGLTVAPGDVDALAAALDRVLADPQPLHRDRGDIIAALELEDAAARHVAALSALGRDGPRR
jgi:glycosyltransferase involved in cell wall biosynthesis